MKRTKAILIGLTVTAAGLVAGAVAAWGSSHCPMCDVQYENCLAQYGGGPAHGSQFMTCVDFREICREALCQGGPPSDW